MKHLASIAAALAIFSATSVSAGDLKAPKMEQAIVIEDTKGGTPSSSMVLVAMTGLLMFAVIAR